MIELIRELNFKETEAALPMIFETFEKYEAPNYTGNGSEAFKKAVSSEDFLKRLTSYGAFEGDELIGIIAFRNRFEHVALFFTKSDRLNQGTGSSLWNFALESNTNAVITVNSSVYAEGIYKKLGFEKTEELQRQDGICFVPMQYKNFLYKLTAKDDRKAYAYSKILMAKSAENDSLYKYFDDFAGLMTSSNSYIRTRGFGLCCAQSRWDNGGKISEALPLMFKLLHDEKPAAVRQCLSALHETALFRPELSDVIIKELEAIELTKYKDTMAPLIEKDINELRQLLD